MYVEHIKVLQDLAFEKRCKVFDQYKEAAKEEPISLGLIRAQEKMNRLDQFILTINDLLEE